jgi:protein-S-isoprenylcysteine O-methyltransferase Ste14
VEAASLRRTARRRLLAAFLVLALMLFLPAGTLRFWQAWAYLAIFLVLVTGAITYLVKHDPALLERRMRLREKAPGQRRIVVRSSVVFLALLVVPALDRRFGWSPVPVAAVVAADGLIVLGYALFLRVLRENPHASRIIEVEEGQRVVTTGPYAVVRHPMYVAVLLIYLATPLALGSFWGLAPAPLLVWALVARILGEERLLRENLDGYRAYAERTRYRLVPGVW